MNFDQQEAVVSHHGKGSSILGAFLFFLLFLAIGAATLNFLLDADVFQTRLDIPYTDILEPGGN